MKVRDVMSPLQVAVGPDARVAQVARLLLDRNLTGVPVVEGEALVGLITRRDVVTKHAHIHLPVFIGLLGYVAPLELPGSREEVARALAVTASELMETDVVTIEPDAEVDDAATLMVDKDADPIPVVENGRLIGIITMADIIRLVLVEEGDGSNG
jgi:CBS domain-containing protein